LLDVTTAVDTNRTGIFGGSSVDLEGRRLHEACHRSAVPDPRQMPREAVQMPDGMIGPTIFGDGCCAPITIEPDPWMTLGGVL
jgi:hypothetical protein